MKKIIKYIPIIIAPMLLASCKLINGGGLFPFPIGGSSEQQPSSEITSLEPSESSTSSEESSQSSSSSQATSNDNSSHHHHGGTSTSESQPSENSSDYSSEDYSEDHSEDVSFESSEETPSEDLPSEEESSQYSEEPSEYSEEPSSEDSPSEEEDKAEWTIMVYMCGADLESQDLSGTEYEGYGYNNGNTSGYASMDIDEMLSVSGQPDDVNILIETGGAKKWAKSGIRSDKLGRWHIRNKSLVNDDQITKDNMGLQSTLQSYLDWGVNTYPAKKYGLILWNHGGGMDGCCFDENYSDDSLTTTEITNAVSAVRNNNGISEKFEFITYDACLMAIQDVAEHNSANFKYMLSSQESESGYGYDYDAWLPFLYNNVNIATPDLLETIGHTFMQEEAELYEYWGDPFDQTQSVYDLGKMSEYKTAFESLASGLKGIITSSSKWNTFKNVVNVAQKYGYVSDYSYYNNGYVYDIFDAEQVLNAIKGNSSYSSVTSKVNDVLDVLDDVVVYEEHGDGTTGCGMNIFIPISGVNSKSSYQDQTNFSTWYSLVGQYGSWY